MNFIQAVILGLVQGLTEFIPISSTGHLILMRRLIDLPLEESLSFDAILQLATSLAVLIYFWKDIKNLFIAFLSIFNWKNKLERNSSQVSNRKLFWAIIIGTIPAVFFGLILQSYMDTIFRGTTVVAYALVVGSILFYLAEKYYEKSKISSDEITFKKALSIGFFQCLALIPGMSRSGSTISGGLFCNLTREMTIRFSFILSLPIILGSGLKKLWDIYQAGMLSSMENSLLIASIFAFISGIFAIHFLLKFIKNHSLNYFGVYRLILASVILLFL